MIRDTTADDIPMVGSSKAARLASLRFDLACLSVMPERTTRAREALAAAIERLEAELAAEEKH